MGKKFDQAVFTGIDKPTGFRADLLTSALNTGATITPGSNSLYKSISDAMTKVEESGYNVTGFLGGVDLKGKFREMVDTTGQPIKGTEIDSMSKAFVDNGAWDKTLAQLLVGDFSQAVYAIRQDITFKILDQAVIQDP
ncbi:major capsid protein, partial [human gut metagenome]